MDKVFHFVFGLKPQKEVFHLSYYICIKSCLEINKPDKIYFHYHFLPHGFWWDLIKPHLILNPVELDPYLSSYKYEDPQISNYRYAHLSDLVRLDALIKYGGIYADIDTLFLAPIPEEFYQEKFILGLEKLDETQGEKTGIDGSLCNAWIASEKNSKFAELWRESLLSEFNGSWSSHSTFLPYRLSKQYPHLIRIEPTESFYFFDWTSVGINNIFLNSVSLPPNVYSIHLWAHLWWHPKRKDFSLFNNEVLTINYLRFSKSTYATRSLSYLPKGLKFNYLAYVKEKLSILLPI